MIPLNPASNSSDPDWLRADIPPIFLSHQAQPALHAAQISLPLKAWTAVVGLNGAGKSTLLTALAGLAPEKLPSLHFGTEDASAWSTRTRARKLSWLGQNEMTPWLLEMRAFALVLLGRLPHHGWLHRPSPQDERMAEQAMLDCGCAHLAERLLGDLSGGERQRVLLARCLAVDAPWLLMDEPLAHLDMLFASHWLQLMRTLIAKGRCIVAVVHDLNVALCADWLLVLANGRVVASGAPSDPQTQSALIAAYGNAIEIVPITTTPVTAAQNSSRRFIALPLTPL